MKIYIDQKAIKRNSLIGKILRWASLVCMLIGLLAVFSQEIAEKPSLFTLFFTIMILGVLLSSVSGYFTSRFGKSPRPDELIDKSFKGLDDRYHLFHYQSSIPHLLLGPAGVWAITPTFIDGEILFDEKKNNWIHKKNSLLNRILSKEYFPNPISEHKNHSKDFKKILQINNLDQNIELNSLIILMHKNVDFDAKSEFEKILLLPFDKVKDRFRKIAKTTSQPEEIIDPLIGVFSK
jgi:hypothetical protein